jgi:hypothetical protein
VLETIGTQEYEVRGDFFVKRLAESYGDAAAEEGSALTRRLSGPTRSSPVRSSPSRP